MGIRTETYNSSGDLLSSVDTRTLEEVKELKKREVNTYRDVILNGGVTFEGIIYDSDERGRQNLSGMATAIANGVPLPDNFTWRDANNIEHAMDEADILSFSAIMITFVNSVYSTSWAHKNAIDALSSIDGVDGYDFKTSWPT